jgi:hypothetical protein
MFDCAPRVTRHTSTQYSSSCYTRVNGDVSIFFTAAMIHVFRSARSRGNGGTYCVRSLLQWFVPLGKRGYVAMVEGTVYVPPLPRDLVGTDYCSSEEYQCTNVDACVARTWISYRCVPYQPWYPHRTSPVVKKNFFFSFPVAVDNSMKVFPLVFLL